MILSHTEIVRLNKHSKNIKRNNIIQVKPVSYNSTQRNKIAFLNQCMHGDGFLKYNLCW